MKARIAGAAYKFVMRHALRLVVFRFKHMK